LKASDQVLRYSIDKATVELLYLPVPAAHTFRVKSFIDTVVYRVGDASGGSSCCSSPPSGLDADPHVDDRRSSSSASG
jgi:ATP/ADP translocase